MSRDGFSGWSRAGESYWDRCSPAEALALKLGIEYGLTYRTQVNLEGTINNLLNWGLTIAQAEDAITDVIDNLDFLEEVQDAQQTQSHGC